MRVVYFFRKEGWYLVSLMDPADCGRSLEEQAADHAALNPGTLRIEDSGRVLWQADSKGTRPNAEPERRVYQ